ncbi:MAG: hypothetical protein JWO05_1438 [Gemmatimonadetes bacterium]|nr:hypothetical protein [Gemmatimonadota bacterium]
MIRDTLTAIVLRELRALRREVEEYADEASLWAVPQGISNSGGNLVLHLCGNLQHYIGAVLGRTGYVRQRDLEFSRRDVPRAELLREIDATIAAVERSLAGMDLAVLADPYPEPIGGNTVNGEEFLVHLVSHLAYHLGQVDYHRRIVTGSAGTVSNVSVKELPSARPQPAR